MNIIELKQSITRKTEALIRKMKKGQMIDPFETKILMNDLHDYSSLLQGDKYIHTYGESDEKNSCEQDPCTPIIPADKIQLTLEANPIDQGTTYGTGVYMPGDSVTVYQDQLEGFVFVNWTEDGNIISTSSSFTYTIYTDTTLIQNFEIDTSNVHYGFLYNWYAITDPKGLPINGWRVEDVIEGFAFRTYLGGELTGGGKLKSLAGFDAPNGGATNEFNFNGVGTGIRNNIGEFEGFRQKVTYATSDDLGGDDSRGFTLSYNGTSFIFTFTYKYMGSSIYFKRDATLLELALPDGTLTDDYIGNDGTHYRTAKISDYIFTIDPIKETKFRDNSWIPGFDGGVYTQISDATWLTLTTPALCAYNNDLNNV